MKNQKIYPSTPLPTLLNTRLSGGGLCSRMMSWW